MHTDRAGEITTALCLVYGYGEEEAQAHLAMHNARIVQVAYGRVLNATKVPVPRYARMGRQSARRRLWWRSGVAQALDSLLTFQAAYEAVERSWFASTLPKKD